MLLGSSHHRRGGHRHRNQCTGLYPVQGSHRYLCQHSLGQCYHIHHARHITHHTVAALQPAELLTHHSPRIAIYIIFGIHCAILIWRCCMYQDGCPFVDRRYCLLNFLLRLDHVRVHHGRHRSGQSYTRWWSQSGCRRRIYWPNWPIDWAKIPIPPTGQRSRSRRNIITKLIKVYTIMAMGKMAFLYVYRIHLYFNVGHKLDICQCDHWGN